MLQWSKLRILSNLFLFLFLYPCFPFGSGFFEFTEFHRQWIKPLGNWFSKKCIFFLFFFFVFVILSLSFSSFVALDQITLCFVYCYCCSAVDMKSSEENEMQWNRIFVERCYFIFLFFLFCTYSWNKCGFVWWDTQTSHPFRFAIIMHSMWSGPRYIFIRSEFFINKIKWKIKEEFWNEMEWSHCVCECVREWKILLCHILKQWFVSNANDCEKTRNSIRIRLHGLICLEEIGLWHDAHCSEWIKCGKLPYLWRQYWWHIVILCVNLSIHRFQSNC